jgi:hypothetical protein
MGGALALHDCRDATRNSTILINGSSLVAEIFSAGQLLETVDRALTPALMHSTGTFAAASHPIHVATEAAVITVQQTTFILLQRKGMWEFYLGDFLILPERLQIDPSSGAAPACIELHASGGLEVTEAWTMSDMPSATPVPVAPTYPHAKSLKK